MVVFFFQLVATCRVFDDTSMKLVNRKNIKMTVDMTLRVRVLLALTFVPQEDVIESFEAFIETEYFTTYEKLLTSLIYFESNWIGRLQMSGRREPKYRI